MALPEKFQTEQLPDGTTVTRVPAFGKHWGVWFDVVDKDGRELGSTNRRDLIPAILATA
jgi:hypothetical protein